MTYPDQLRTARPPPSAKGPERVIGIVGGLGPWAHIELERRILRTAREQLNLHNEQQFPEWIVSSVPQTPDRTEALLADGPTPISWLTRSLKRLEPLLAADGTPVTGADFAIIPCITSHVYLGELRAAVRIPILDMVWHTARRTAEHFARARIGVLATTGTLRTGICHRALRRVGLDPVCLLDLSKGEDLQRRLVMETLYGCREDSSSPEHGGIKLRGPIAADRETLETAADHLVRAGAEAVILGCTELSLAAEGFTRSGRPFLDPLTFLAEEAVRVAYGYTALPTASYPPP